MNWKILLLIVFLPMKWAIPVHAQHFDKHVTETVNAWHIHGVSRTLSASSEVLPVAVPVGMLAYGALKSDKTIMKDAVYIGTTVIEAIAVSYGMKHLTDRQRPYMKYPEIIHPHGGHTDSSSFPSNHTATAFSLATSLSLSQMVCDRPIGSMGLWRWHLPHQSRLALSDGCRRRCGHRRGMRLPECLCQQMVE